MNVLARVVDLEKWRTLVGGGKQIDSQTSFGAEPPQPTTSYTVSRVTCH